VHLRLACVALFLAVASANAFAQAWPSKPIRTILSFAGGADIIARIVAQHLQEALGQPVVVEAMSGAGGAVGAQYVARAAPDGYTIFLSTSSTQVMNQFLSKNTGYDPIKDFTPIARTSETVLMVVANQNLPVSTIKELIEYAKKNPGKLSYGTSGVGTTHHLSGEQIALLTGIDWVHVPYKGGPPVVTDTMTGQVQVGFTILATVATFLPKLKLLGINNEQRFAGMPNVPTITEQLPGYEPPPVWVGYFGPAGLPQPIVQRLHGEITKTMSAPDVQAKLTPLGLVARPGPPEELTRLIKRDLANVGKLVKQVGIKPE
jgi:tripartite-type tricarboxylate transporter receptor subunit TctC